MEKAFDFTSLLKNHEKKHKQKPMQFISVAGGVQKRLDTNLKHRRNSRLTVFDNLRKLSRCESPQAPDIQSKVEHRRIQLEKWKEEKEKRKQEAAAQKKKPFLTGVAHAPLKFVPPPPPRKVVPSTSGRVTRSQTAKLNVPKPIEIKPSKSSFAPKNASFQPPIFHNMTVVPVLARVAKKPNNKNSISFNPVLPVPQKQTNKQTRSKINKMPEPRGTRNGMRSKNNVSNTKITKNSNTKIKEQPKVLQSSSSSDLESTKSLQSISETDMTQSKSTKEDTSSIDMSPVVKTRRKSTENLDKIGTPVIKVPESESGSEKKLRSPREIGRSPEQIVEEASRFSPRVTMSRGKDNARKEMKKKLEEGVLDEDASNMDSVVHFRRQLNSEITRINQMCDLWEKIQEQTVIPEHIVGECLGAVGQGRLLVRQKLRQFSSLVERCAARPEGVPAVTAADLHGFWDMVFMQIENIDMRFKKLEALRGRGWVEEVAQAVPKATKVNCKKPVRPAATSKLKDLIAAARKAKKSQQTENIEPEMLEPEVENKTFEAGFFSVRSPLRQPATPRAPPLLKTVLSSEAKKSASKSATPFAMLRASILGKNMEEEGFAPLPDTPINLNATPGRSILKSANPVSEKKPGKKSIKVVLFDDHNNSMNQDDKASEDVDHEVLTVSHKLSELNTDSTPLTLPTDSQKENKRTSAKKLMRQDAVDDNKSYVMTRSRRKSMNTPIVTEEEIEGKSQKRSTRRKKALQESVNVMDDQMLTNETPKRSMRTRKSIPAQKIAI